MHLTPDQRNIGKENFYAAIGSGLLRRDFLKEVNKNELTSGNGLGSKFFEYGTVEKPVRVAVLGTGDEGCVLIGSLNPKYVQVVAIADIRPFSQYRAFYGDVSNPDASGLLSTYGWKDKNEARKHVRVYGDYRELLEKEKDNTDPETSIEAVIIALPLFLHAPAAIACMEQGWHVFTEKLMGHTVAACKEMARVAEKQQKHCATGHQRHYSVLYDHAVKMLQSGVLGDLHYIRAQWHRSDQPGNDRWQPPLPKGIKANDGKQTGKLEKDLADFEEQLALDAKGEKKLSAKDRELIVKKIALLKAQMTDEVLVKGGEAFGFTFKSAEEYGYESKQLQIDGSAKPYDRPAAEELIRWRLYNRTGAGLIAELGSHQLEAASIFMAAIHGGQRQYPLTVSATTARTIFPQDLDAEPVDREADDHIHCVFDYAASGYDKNDELGKQRKITVAYSSINGNGFGGDGETVFGTRGTLVIETEKEAMLFRGAAVNDKVKISQKTRGREKYLDIDVSDDGDPLSAAIALQATFGGVSRGYCEQIEHWAFCIRENPAADQSKPMPRCYPAVALADAVISLVTNIAAARSETIEFDLAWFDYKKDETPEAKFAETDEQKKHFTPNLGRYS